VRLFLALPLPPQVLQRLSSITGEMREGFPSLKVVRPEGLHLTLVFLGERPPGEAEGVGSLLDSPSLAVPRIPATLGGYGQFPPRGAMRVVFTPVKEGAREVVELQQTLTEVLVQGGIRLEEEARPFRPGSTRGFTPHITLARSRGGGADAERLAPLLDFEERFVFDRLVLFQSLLRPGGAEYRALKSVMLR
jgi:2'-5' RNA ligase